MIEAKVREIGDLTMVDGAPENDNEYQYKCAMVLVFESLGELHEALQAGKAEFSW